MLSLNMSITVYKKLARDLLMITIAIWGFLYLLLYLAGYLARKSPQIAINDNHSVNLFEMVSGLLTFVFLLASGLALILVIMTVIKVVQMVIFGGKSHFKIDGKSVKVLTPLNFTGKQYVFNSRDCKTLSINIDNSDHLGLCVTLEVQRVVLEVIFWKTEITKHAFYLYKDDYSKLVDSIKKNRPDLKLTFITKSEDSRG